MILTKYDNLMRLRRQQSIFPWLLFLATWMIMFGIQHRMDASCQVAGSVADLVGSAQTGSLPHQILTLLLGVIGSVLVYQNRERLQFKGVPARLLCLYFGWILMSATWSDDLIITARKQLALTLMSVFAAGCVARLEARTLPAFVLGIATLNLAPGLIAEVRCDNLHPLVSGNRFGGTLEPNTQGASLSLAVILLLWIIPWKRTYVCVSSLCAAGCLLTFVVMTGSRTSMLALAVALVFSALLAALRKQKKQFRMFFPMLTLLLSAALTLVAAIWSEISPVKTEVLTSTLHAQRDQGDVTELTGRVQIWEECLEFVVKRPVLGYGFGAFWSGPRQEMISDDLGWPIPHAHSAYIDQLLALGAPGLAIYALLLLTSFIVCIRRFLLGGSIYGAWAAVLLFFIIDGITESITILPTLPQFVLILSTLHLALVNYSPLREETEPNHGTDYSRRLHMQPTTHA